jgi:hypothetical protein
MHAQSLKLFLVVLSLLILAGSCTASEPAIEGLIYWLEGSQFLVVSGIDNVDIPYDEWFTAGDHTAIVFTAVPQTQIRLTHRYGSMADLKVGSRVRVWVDGGIAKSYPGQAAALHVEILD